MYGSDVNPNPFQEPRFYPTQCNMPEDIRIQVAEWLNQTLATSIDLNSQLKQATWMIRGMNFYPLYLLINEISDQISYHIQIVSERISTLACTPLVSIRIAVQHSQLPEFPFGDIPVEKILKAIAQRIASHSQFIKQSPEELYL
ncbi:MAG: hypothetical protein F6K35_45100 [Okeania sp. SIO2H7]|nr:hypothetical protein [Okeania sp. SIO2H7]